jgi:flagellar protein FlaG
MDVSSVHLNVQPVAGTASPAPAEQSTANRDVVQAVKALNATEMFGQENELVFQLDRQSRRIIVQIVDRKTKEVVSQVPPEYVLRLSEDLKNPSHSPPEDA